jgi:ssDNA-binding replication factor A large subunit
MNNHRVQAVGNNSVSKYISSGNKPKIDIPEDQMFMPVSCLNTFTQDWIIKVKIIKKYDLKHWTNAKGTGMLLNLDLMDKENTQIQATCYNDAA